MGTAQTARHARTLITERVIRLLNAQHITTDKLDTAIRDVIDEYARFRLPYIWGTGKAAIADGTHYKLYENNLLGERQIRYGGYGSVAYHHISDSYVALFSHFIACGVWEAIYILDGLLKNKSLLQPDSVHGDTQSQFEVVFGLAQEGHNVSLDIVTTFSPNLTEHIKRFGEYVIDLETIPPPLRPDKPFLPPEITSE